MEEATESLAAAISVGLAVPIILSAKRKACLSRSKASIRGFGKAEIPWGPNPIRRLALIDVRLSQITRLLLFACNHANIQHTLRLTENRYVANFLFPYAIAKAYFWRHPRSKNHSLLYELATEYIDTEAASCVQL